MRPRTRSTAPSATSLADLLARTLSSLELACVPTSLNEPRSPSPSAMKRVNPWTMRWRSSTSTPYSLAAAARRMALVAFQPPLTTSSASARRSKSVRSSAVSPVPRGCTALGAMTVTPVRAVGLVCSTTRFAARRAAVGCNGPLPSSNSAACNRSAAYSNCMMSRRASLVFDNG